MATSRQTREWERTYNTQIKKLAEANGVDMSVASSMLQANLQGGGRYQGGGTINSQQASNDLSSAQAASRNQSANRTANQPTADDYYSDYLKKAEQEAQRAQQLQIKSAIDKNNAYIPKINQQTDQQLQEAYILAQQAKINAPQSLSAMGYTGGAVESSLMGLDTNYQNNRNALETSRNTSLDSIYQNAADIQSSGNANLADLSANYYNQMAQQQANQQAAAQAQSNWDKQYALQQQEAQKNDFTDTLGAYAGDYRAPIMKIQGDGDTSNDWQVPYLQQARNQKIQGITEQSQKYDNPKPTDYTKIVNNAIDNINSLYVSTDPITGVPKIYNKAGIDAYITSLGLPLEQANQLYAMYGIGSVYSEGGR